MEKYNTIKQIKHNQQTTQSHAVQTNKIPDQRTGRTGSLFHHPTFSETRIS